MVSFKKYNNDAKKRTEFLIVNFDYVDGNDYLSKLFHKEYGFSVDEKIDGIWFNIVRISLKDCVYEMLWHEETGNSIYSLNQSETENLLLQSRLEKIIEILNTEIQS